MRPSWIERAIAGVGFFVVFSLGAWIWCHRIELIYVPLAWKEVQWLRASSSGAATPDCCNQSDELDEAACRLIGIQRAGFAGAFDVALYPLSDSRGRTRYLVRYQDPQPATSLWGHDHGVQPVPSSHAGDDHVLIEWLPHYTFDAIDECGRLLGDAFGPPAGCGDSYVLSLDRKGIVPRGARALTALREPLSPPVKGEVSVPPERIRSLLASPEPGDLYRALRAIEAGPSGHWDLASPLLTHADPDLRARAAAVCGRDKTRAGAMRHLLSDPEPVVRAAAVRAMTFSPGWEEAVERLKDDPWGEVAGIARATLAASGRSRYALPAVLELLRSRDCSAATSSLDFEPLPKTRELAEAVIRWYDGNLAEWSHCAPYPALHYHLEAFPPCVLRPLVREISALCRRLLSPPDEDFYIAEHTLLPILARLGDREGDRVLAEGLLKLTAKGTPSPRILDALLERDGVFDDAEGLRALGDALRRPRPAGAKIEEWEPLAFLVLIRAGVPGLAEDFEEFFQGNGFGDVFCGQYWRFAPPSLAPHLLALAFQDPMRHAAAVAEILSLQASDEIAARLPAILELYGVLSACGLPRAYLAARLVELSSDSADSILWGELERPESDPENPAQAILVALLRGRGACSSVRAIDAVERIASWSEDDVPPDLQLRVITEDTGYEEDCPPPQESFGFWCDPPLLASLVLLRWEGRACRSSREILPEWRETPVWQSFAPEDIR